MEKIEKCINIKSFKHFWNVMESLNGNHRKYTTVEKKNMLK